MGFYMFLHVAFLGKSLFALKARIWFISKVDSTVSDQVLRPGEGLVTGGAGERLVSCVCPLVSLQVP